MPSPYKIALALVAYPAVMGAYILRAKIELLVMNPTLDHVIAVFFSRTALTLVALYFAAACLWFGIEIAARDRMIKDYEKIIKSLAEKKESP